MRHDWYLGPGRSDENWGLKQGRSLHLCADVIPIVDHALVPTVAIGGDALPSGGDFTADNGTISASGSRMDISQTTESGIINWSDFSAGSGNRVHFDNANSSTLNLVTGNVPSRINGNVTATGSVFLINPPGVVVGNGGMVATGGLVRRLHA